MIRRSIILLSLCATASAWSPQPKTSRTTFRATTPSHEKSFDPANLSHINIQSSQQHQNNAAAPIIRPEASAALLASSIPLLFLATPESASAATAFTSNAVPSALAAYGHYISLIGIMACLMIERLTIKPNMTPDEEDFIAAADVGYGLWGVLIAYTGYLRIATEKGFEFYSHEPLFWLKIAFVGVFGASSFFNTVTIIKRAIDRKSNDKFEPMGEKLATRMKKICNAELVAVSIIPLTATFMARGVGYSQDIPWQAEAGLAAAVFGGLSFKYVKEALTFEDEPFEDVQQKIESSSDSE